CRGALRRRRDSDHDSGAAASAAQDLHRAADAGRTLVHGAQAQVPGEAPVGVEPDTVVGDLQHHRVFVRLQVDVDAPGPGVLDLVQEGLLADPVQRLLDLDGQLWLGAGYGLAGDVMPGADCLDLPVESRH